MEHRTQLHIMWMAALVGAIGCNTVGALPVSAFVPQRCSIPSRQVNLAHTPWNKDAQKARSHVVMVASARAQEEEQETIPKDDTFSLPGWWRELTYPGSRPSTTVAKTFKDFADRTGGIWRTRSLGFLPATVSVCLTLNAVVRCVLSCFPRDPELLPVLDLGSACFVERFVLSRMNLIWISQQFFSLSAFVPRTHSYPVSHA